MPDTFYKLILPDFVCFSGQQIGSAFDDGQAPRYSGYYYASTTFEYATVMLYGLSFQTVLLCCLHATA